MKTDLKILTIGNSFTDSLSAYFQQVVESAGCQLHFERANHGGCELHRHWSYIDNEEHDRVYKMYQDRRFTMREILEREKWDIVTIQQASHLSWREESYQPFANNICNYIEQHAPGAEIVIQQTWAYREDDPRIRPGGEWCYSQDYLDRACKLGATIESGPFHVSQTQMYESLTAAYTKLAKSRNLRIIPTGYAVQLSRKGEKNPFKPYDPELLAKLRWPDFPSQSGDVVGALRWVKDQLSGEMKITGDFIHLNERGRYMQACLWFAFLYERPVSEITFVPDCIGNSDAAFLRDCAQRAADTFPQVKK